MPLRAGRRGGGNFSAPCGCGRANKGLGLEFGPQTTTAPPCPRHPPTDCRVATSHKAILRGYTCDTIMSQHYQVPEEPLRIHPSHTVTVTTSFAAPTDGLSLSFFGSSFRRNLFCEARAQQGHSIDDWQGFPTFVGEIPCFSNLLRPYLPFRWPF
jgi:hypothetical protein